MLFSNRLPMYSFNLIRELFYLVIHFVFGFFGSKIASSTRSCKSCDQIVFLNPFWAHLNNYDISKFPFLEEIIFISQ